MGDIAAGLEAVWAARDGDAAEPKAGLSLARIVAAAVEIADADGLGAVSMGRVAKRLGFTTMSLYRHVASKEELVLHMQDAATGPVDVADPTQDGDWRADLEQWSWAVLDRLRAHSWLMQAVSMLGPPVTPNQLAWFDRGLRALAPTGLPEGEKVLTILLIQAHQLGDLLFASADTPSATDGVPASTYDAMLARFLDPERFPALLAALTGGGFEASPDPAVDRDEYYTYGLAMILDGIERRLAALAEPGAAAPVPGAAAPVPGAAAPDPGSAPLAPGAPEDAS